MSESSTVQAAGLARRDFLKVCAAATVAAPLGALANPPKVRAVLQVLLVGGPSQLDTFDPKPDAPSDVRGPFASISTRLPGVRVSELFPRIAASMDRFSILRTVFHSEPPLHEPGLELLQTGTFSSDGAPPHLGALAAAHGTDPSVSPWLVLPRKIGDTGVELPRGQSAGRLGRDFEAVPCAPAASTKGAELYGATSIGAMLGEARRRIESGARVVTVNMFGGVFGRVTWDAHAAGGRLPATLEHYRALGPALDQALSALVADLSDRGLLESTLVIAAGEFGRSPRLNGRGGRDHWPRCWSILLAGGGVRGGSVVGQSDPLAGEPLDRPVHAREIFEFAAWRLGLTPQAPQSLVELV